MAKALLKAVPDTPLRRLIVQHAGDEQATVKVCMTPEMAADALSQNGINRPVRARHREFLTRQMTEGRWHPTHQGIAFSSDGELLDGQHRLLALTDFGQPLVMPVTFNLSRESFATIDFNAMPRSLADVTGLDAKAIQPVAFMYRLTVDRGATYKLDVEDFAPYWACFGKPSKDLLEYCGKARRVLSSAPIRAGAIFVEKAAGVDTASAYRSLVMQDYPRMPVALQRLNRHLLTEDVRSPVERFVRAAMAFERQDAERLPVRDVLAKAADYRSKIRALTNAHTKRVGKIR